MARPTFIQSAWGGFAIFQVTQDYLEVSPRYLGGRKDLHIPLRLLSASPQRVVKYSRHWAVILLSVAALLGWVIWKLISYGEPYGHFVRYVEPMILPFLIGGARALFPFVRYEFRDADSGRIAFNVLREMHQGRACDAFVAQLMVCIDAAKGALPPDALAQHLQSIEAPTPPPFARRWLLSIIFGAAAAGLPWVPGFVYLSDPFTLPIIMICAIFGLLLGVLAFMRGEPHRWFALIGMISAIIPPYFY